jgi:hypothetical protein
MASKPVIKGSSFWLAFERFALVFSFTVNIILVVVVMMLAGLLLPIRDYIARPTMDRVMTEIERLGNTHIQTTVVVEDEIPVIFDLPLNQPVNVTTMAPVPIKTAAYFTLPGGGGYIRGTVSLNLPANTVLPVQLDTTVPVDQMIPVRMEIPVDINLGDTDLKTSVDNFEALLKPIHDFLGK